MSGASRIFTNSATSEGIATFELTVLPNATLERIPLEFEALRQTGPGQVGGGGIGFIVTISQV